MIVLRRLLFVQKPAALLRHLRRKIETIEQLVEFLPNWIRESQVPPGLAVSSAEEFALFRCEPESEPSPLFNLPEIKDLSPQQRTFLEATLENVRPKSSESPTPTSPVTSGTKVSTSRGWGSTIAITLVLGSVVIAVLCWLNFAAEQAPRQPTSDQETLPASIPTALSTTVPTETTTTDGRDSEDGSTVEPNTEIERIESTSAHPKSLEDLESAPAVVDSKQMLEQIAAKAVSNADTVEILAPAPVTESITVASNSIVPAREEENSRDWHDVKGRRITASYLGYRDGRVGLMMMDTGSEHWVTIETLREADRAFVISKTDESRSQKNLVGAVRIWNDRTGHQVQAGYVRREGSSAKLLKLDGTIVVVPLQLLSDLDQQFVRKHSAN